MSLSFAAKDYIRQSVEYSDSLSRLDFPVLFQANLACGHNVNPGGSSASQPSSDLERGQSFTLIISEIPSPVNIFNMLSPKFLVFIILLIGYISDPSVAAPAPDENAPRWIRNGADQAESSQSNDVVVGNVGAASTTESDPYADCLGDIVKQFESQSDLCPICDEPIADNWLEQAKCKKHCYHRNCYTRWQHVYVSYRAAIQPVIVSDVTLT